MSVQTPFSPSQSFTSVGNSCSSNHLSLPTMARRPIVGGNWKCNPESFSKLDDLIKIMKLEPKREVVVGGILEVRLWVTKNWLRSSDGQHIPELNRICNMQFHRVTFSSIRNECDTSACDVFVCPSPLHVAYVASKVKDSHVHWRMCGIFALECVSGSLRSNKTCCIWHHFCMYLCMYVQENIHVCAQNCGFKGCGAFTGETAVEQLKEHRSAHQSDSISADFRNIA